MRVDPRVLAVVSAVGALGALGRFAIVTAWPHRAGDFPWANWTVNVTGCLLLGMLVALADRRRPGRPLIRPFLGTGVLGGYTTFSAWAVETLQSRPWVALGYAAATVVGSLLAAWAGGAVVALLGRTR